MKRLLKDEQRRTTTYSWSCTTDLGKYSDARLVKLRGVASVGSESANQINAASAAAPRARICLLRTGCRPMQTFRKDGARTGSSIMNRNM